MARLARSARDRSLFPLTDVGSARPFKSGRGSASHRVGPDDMVARRRCAARIAQALQHAIMRSDRLPERRTAVVGQTMLGGQALDDRAQLPVMNVADSREQMVLDLIVQPADVPGQQPVAARGLWVVRIW